MSPEVEAAVRLRRVIEDIEADRAALLDRALLIDVLARALARVEGTSST